ncbi:MAG: serine hydrolase [Fimbriimonadaceae bacterium]|nr:serine hydrolase [Fimbriimonadaceae bacterium]QYK56685.1 MAG: serine hydrolase [Fimbriimonadaceae bacterium]
MLVRPWPFFVAATLMPVFSLGQVPTDLEAQIDKIAVDWNRKSGPGGVIAVARDGKMIFSKSYGLADLDHSVKNTPDTVMDVGSVSKQFTAMAILLLEEDGKLKTSDEITKYVPEVPTFGRKITLDNLLHMNSGLRDYLNVWLIGGYDFIEKRTFDDMLRTLSRQQGLNADPGEEFNYCNSGYALMAVIIERVSGKPIHTFCKERIFEPLGMKNTYFASEGDLVQKDRAVSYVIGADGKWRMLWSRLGTTGDGGLHTTVADLLLWHENFYDNKLGQGKPDLITKALSLTKLNNGQESPYAYGYFLDEIGGNKRVQHGGNWLGYNAATARFPDHHLSIFALGNAGDNKAQSIADEIARFVLQVPKGETLKEIEVPAADLEKYVGTYRVGSGIVLDVTLEGGRLMVQATGQAKFPVFPMSATRFFWKVVKAEIEFKADGSSATLFQNGQEIVFNRSQPFTPSPELVKDLPGTYESVEAETSLTIYKVDGMLYAVSERDSEAVPVTLSSSDRATIQGLGADLMKDATGKVRGFLLDFGRAKGIRFVKAKSSVVPEPPEDKAKAAEGK